MIVIEDYLSVRPENRERLKKLIEAGRVLLVDWYISAGTNTVAPESLIRNLLMGKQMAEEFGGNSVQVIARLSYGPAFTTPTNFPGLLNENGAFLPGDK